MQSSRLVPPAKSEGHKIPGWFLLILPSFQSALHAQFLLYHSQRSIQSHYHIINAAENTYILVILWFYCHITFKLQSKYSVSLWEWEKSLSRGPNDGNCQFKKSLNYHSMKHPCLKSNGKLSFPQKKLLKIYVPKESLVQFLVSR